MDEYIYILSNPAMPGLIKVGKTTTHPTQRMGELHSTGVPTPFEMEFSLIVPNCSTSERSAHQALNEFRVAENREFFCIPVARAIKIILEKLTDYEIHYFKKSHNINKILKEIERRKSKNRQRDAAVLEEFKRKEEDRIRNFKSAQEEIAACTAKIHNLGRRPKCRELSGIGALFWFFYMPFPIGWMVWLGAIFNLLDGDWNVAAILMTALAMGYFSNRKLNKFAEEYEKIITPFRNLENEIEFWKKISRDYEFPNFGKINGRMACHLDKDLLQKLNSAANASALELKYKGFLVEEFGTHWKVEGELIRQEELISLAIGEAKSGRGLSG